MRYCPPTEPHKTWAHLGLRIAQTAFFLIILTARFAQAQTPNSNALSPIESNPPASRALPNTLDGADVMILQPDPQSDPKPCDLEKEFPKVKMGGFFQADWGGVYQDAVNRATLGDIQNGAGFRRARLNAHGDAWQDVGYMIEFDFTFLNRFNIMDIYLDLRNQPGFNRLRIGHWRQPFGMDGLTSVKELTFLERALPFAFFPFRQTGIGFQNHSADESATWALSGYRFQVDPFGSSVGDDGGYGLATRLTALPLATPDGARLIHLGTGFSINDPGSNQIRFRNQPEFFVGQSGGLLPAGAPSALPVFVDTGAIAATTTNLFNVEAAMVIDSLYMQSEIVYARVGQPAGPTLAFSGAYVHAGYFLAGETRQYNRSAGVFGRVKPRRDYAPGCGGGAWEIAARWSYLDLNDATVLGGRLNDLTFGLNWYLNPRTKFQANYIHAFLTDPILGDSDADILALRAQVDF